MPLGQQQQGQAPQGNIAPLAIEPAPQGAMVPMPLGQQQQGQQEMPILEIPRPIPMQIPRPLVIQGNEFQQQPQQGAIVPLGQQPQITPESINHDENPFPSYLLFDERKREYNPFRDSILKKGDLVIDCLLYTSPSPRDATLSRMPSSA